MDIIREESFSNLSKRKNLDKVFVKIGSNPFVLLSLLPTIFF